jgi:HEAT repeat protein
MGITLLSSSAASGYLVGPALPLTEVEQKAELVTKATVLSEQVVKDPSFQDLPSFEVREATLKVVSVFKGSSESKQIRFRHYAFAPGAAFMYTPQHYELVQGRTYLFFALKEQDGIYQQIWPRHTGKEDQGLFLTADDKPIEGKTITEVVWNELVKLAKSTSVSDVTYAIQQLDEMSGKISIGLHDFDRATALKVVAERIGAKEPELASTAISAIGRDSPYLDDEQAVFWLAGMGKGYLAGFSELKPTGQSNAADENRAALIAVANGSGPAKVRALAIRALGHGVPWKLPPDSERWLRDPEPLVREAAVVLLADSPSNASTHSISAATHDDSAEVRRGAARAIGFGQLKLLIPLLGPMLKDTSAPVRKAAAMSLLSFDAQDGGEVLKANLDTDFRSIFVNALARKDPKPYLAILAETVVKDLQPSDWWGGRVPSADAWSILFKYAKAQPAAEVQAGRLDASLDALEKAHWGSSSEPRALYAFYLVRAMPERAKRFRAQCKTSIPFDMEYYFKMADDSPSTFLLDD